MEVAAKGEKPGAVVVDTLEVTATVVKVNYKKRTLSLKGPEGNVRTFTVDRSVRNFKNIKKGDDVYLRVTERPWRWRWRNKRGAFSFATFSR